MLKIDKINNDNIRIRDGAVNEWTGAIFVANAGDGGIITISPIVAGAHASFSETLENIEINGVSGSNYTPQEAADELNSFIGNYLRSGGGGGSGTSPGAPVTWGSITGNIDSQTDLKDALDRIEGIAQGAKVALVFDSKAQIDEWLAGTYTRPDGITKDDLQPGWDLLNRTQSEPDYWFDGTVLIENDAKTDLSGYYNKQEVDDLIAEKLEYVNELHLYFDPQGAARPVKDALSWETAGDTWGDDSSTPLKTLLRGKLIQKLYIHLKGSIWYTSPVFFDRTAFKCEYLYLTGENSGHANNSLNVGVITGLSNFTAQNISLYNNNSGQAITVRGCDYCSFTDVRLGSQIRFFNSLAFFNGYLGFFRQQGTSNSYQAGQIYAHSTSRVEVTPSQFVLGGNMLTANILTVGEGGVILSNFPPAATTIDGHPNTDYTGDFYNVNSTGVIKVGGTNLKEIFPNGNAWTLNTDTDFVGGQKVYSANIIQAHNISTGRNAENCHPIDAITGLREALENINAGSAGFVPDWNNAVSQRITSYTVPKIGWVVILGQGADYAEWDEETQTDIPIMGKIFINEFSINHRFSEAIHTFPVSEGDNIELKNLTWRYNNIDPDDTPVIVFIPAKAVGVSGNVPEMIEIDQVNGLATKLESLKRVDIDLSDYYDKQQTDALLDEKLDNGNEDDIARVVMNGELQDPSNLPDVQVGIPSSRYTFNPEIQVTAGSGVEYQTISPYSAIFGLLTGEIPGLSSGQQVPGTGYYLKWRPAGETEWRLAEISWFKMSLNPYLKWSIDSINGGNLRGTLTQSDFWVTNDMGQDDGVTSVMSSDIEIEGFWNTQNVETLNPQTFVQKKTWDAPEADNDMKILGLEDGVFKTMLLSDIMPEIPEIPALITKHNELDGRDEKDCHPVSAITDAVEEAQPSQIVSTNIPTANMVHGVSRNMVEFNNKFYLITTSGIYRVNPDKTLEKLTVPNNTFSNPGMSHIEYAGSLYMTSGTSVYRMAADETFYKVGANFTAIGYNLNSFKILEAGVNDSILLLSSGQYGRTYRIESDDTYTQLLDRGGTMFHGQDGNLYAISGESGYRGIYKLNQANTTDSAYGSWELLPETQGKWYCYLGVAANGKTYLGAAVTDSTGVSYLDDDGVVKPTNKTDGRFSYPGCVDSSGNLYFGATDNTGCAYYIDNTGTVIPIQSPVSGYYIPYCDSKNDIYFAKVNNQNDGFLKLVGNELVSVNIPCHSNGYCAFEAYGNLFFSYGNGGGVWYLDKALYLRGDKEWVDISDVQLSESSISGLSEKLSRLDGKDDDLLGLINLKLNKGANDDTARIVLNGAPADPQTQIEKILMNNPAGLNINAGSGLGLGWSPDLLNLLLNDPTNLSGGVKTKLYVSVENRSEGTTSVSILNKASGGFAVNTWAYFDASDNSSPVRIGYYNNAWYAVGSNGIPVDTYYLHKVYWIDSSQQFVQKKSWDAETMSTDMKVLGIENDDFRTAIIARKFKITGSSSTAGGATGLTLPLLNGLELNIAGTVVKINNTGTAKNLDIRRSGEYDNGAGHGGTSDNNNLAANGTYTMASLTSSQLSSAATTDIYIRDNTNNVFYVLHYFISGSSARTTIWGEII